MDNKQSEILYELHPKFNFIYELFMPTGKNIKKTLLILIIFFLIFFILMFGSNNIASVNIKINESLSLLELLKYICYFMFVMLAIKLIVHIVFQILQYKCISYKFYDKYLIYEDNFLNQHKKNIQYLNIKEVEIRRTIWDRILGYGIIVFYTNAENEYGNGLVIYSIKNPKMHYDIIEKLINDAKEVEISKSNDLIQDISDEQKNVKMQDDFINSLKNK